MEQLHDKFTDFDQLLDSLLAGLDQQVTANQRFNFIAKQTEELVKSAVDIGGFVQKN